MDGKLMKHRYTAECPKLISCLVGVASLLISRRSTGRESKEERRRERRLGSGEFRIFFRP